jgi:hypothetical protein
MLMRGRRSGWHKTSCLADTNAMVCRAVMWVCRPNRHTKARHAARMRPPRQSVQRSRRGWVTVMGRPPKPKTPMPGSRQCPKASRRVVRVVVERRQAATNYKAASQPAVIRRLAPLGEGLLREFDVIETSFHERRHVAVVTIEPNPFSDHLQLRTRVHYFGQRAGKANVFAINCRAISY